MKLQTWLKSSGMSVGDFATALGVRVQSAYRYLNGERMPRPEIAAKIETITRRKVTASDLLKGVVNGEGSHTVAENLKG